MASLIQTCACILLLFPHVFCQVSLDSDLKRFVGTLERYAVTPNEVVFLVDESGSIGAENFPQEVLFTELIARLLSVSADNSRVAVITFSTGNVEHMNYIKNSEGNNMCTFLKELWKIDYRGGWTHTRAALIAAGELLKNSRPNSNRIVILISDGQSNNGDPLPIAKELRDKGVIIFAVGVADINEKELLSIATSPDYIYILRDFLYIKQVNEQLKDDIKEVNWDYSGDSNLCNNFCTAGVDCCDFNADCYCGTKGGRYECACRPGYHGTGHQGECKLCPKGTYKSSAGPSSCEKCPVNSTNSKEGSTSILDCFCLPGHEGNPHKNVSCSPVTCVKLSAPKGGILVPLTCGNTFNSECSFKCSKGYCPYFCNKTNPSTNEIEHVMPWNVQPAESRKCLDTRQWSGVEFSCEKIRCPALNYPKNGYHNCTGSDFTFGTTCELTCNKGYLSKGSTVRHCLVSGTWSGEEITCEAVTCPPLKVNNILKVKPEKCGQNNMPFQSTCQYYCKVSFKLEVFGTSNNTLGIRECLATQDWSGGNEKITCTDNTPPSIKCPEDIFKNTDPLKPTALISWKLPVVKDNVNVQRLELLGPVGIKKSDYFPIGATVVEYQATDSSKLKSTCSFTITIKDQERPHLIRNCPSDIEINHDKKTGISVTWEEPVFEDNSGTIANIFHERNSGDLFFWGPPSLVKYRAEDPSGNSEACIFSVKVKPYPCNYAPPPVHGSITCDNWLDGRFCSVFCNDGYDFVEEPEPLYYCFQTTKKWGRLPGSSRRPFKFPWPDCAKQQPPVGSNVNMTMGYKVTNCEDLGSKDKIAQKFIDMLQEIAKKKGLPNLCSPKFGCKVKNVNITCGQHSISRQKRQAESMFAPSDFQNSYSERRKFNFPDVLQDGHHIRHGKHKRHAASDDLLIISVEFDMPQIEIPHIEDGEQYCEDCNKTAELAPELNIIETTAVILEDLKENFTDAIQAIDPLALPDKSFSHYTVDPLCLPGQIPVNKSCVNCPVGTYFDSATAFCTPCSIGEYQDNEASFFCQQCPEGTTTLFPNSKSLDDCKEPCRPGTFSLTGFEPCIACANNTYQDLQGQKKCYPCPPGTTTWRVGAPSAKECTSPCLIGTYSDTGFQPCLSCPHGTYQSHSQQTNCTNCPPGHTTLVESAHNEHYCKVIDFCEAKIPCQHASTCINKVDHYECVCSEGFTGKNCEINTDDCSSDLCLNNGTCIDGINNYTCSCLSGFTGVTCETNVDDCMSDPCLNGATCTDGVNSFICKCDIGFTGKLCEINYYDCASDPCQNGGTCFDMQQNFRCCCPKGFTGRFCEKEINKCDDTPCHNGATCVSKFDSFICICPPEYTGTLCNENINDCINMACKNGGTCQDGVGNFTCICPSPYSGERCETALNSNYGLNFPSAVTSNFVKLHNKHNLYAITLSFWMKTTYKDSHGTPVSYSYQDPVNNLDVENGLTILDVNKLVLYLHGQSFHTGIVGNGDSNWHHCAVTWDSMSGNWAFYWDGKQYKNGSLAVGRYLWSGYFVLGQEQDSIGEGFSTTEAYVGEISQFNVWDYSMTSKEIDEVKSSCGLLGNVIQWIHVKQYMHGDITVTEPVDLCSGIGECTANQCNCIAANASYNDICQRNLSCSPNPCANNQQCTVLDDSSSVCNCHPGFDGKLCQYDVNECLENNGNCSHLCNNTAGSYTCSCPPGMKLKDDGHNCLDVNYCTTDGLIYLDGEKWNANCQECSCNQGNILCSEKQCPNITCQKNELEISIPAECCNTCVSEPTKCTLFSNNTFHTFDGLEYEFSGICRYTLAEDCINGQFSVRFENWKKNSTKKVVFVYSHCTQVTIHPSEGVVIDGSVVLLPFRNNDVHVKEANSKISVMTQRGFSVTWHETGDVIVNSPPDFQHHLCGLCGDFNSDKLNDFTTKQHLPARTSAELGHSWKVDGYKHCHSPKQVLPIKAHPRLPLDGACKFASYSIQRRALKLCNILRKRTFQKCYSKVRPQPYYETCLQDACSCKFNDQCFCDTISAYALECLRNGVIVKHWTDSTICEKRCTNGMVYDDCGPPCPLTCNSTLVIDLQCYLDVCVPGCHCPSGQALHKGKCIPLKLCRLEATVKNELFII